MPNEQTDPLQAKAQFQSNVLVSALKMAFGTLTSRSLGLVREVAFAALFSRTVTDAWTAAFRLPNLFRRLLGEGSLSVSFIPVFIDSRTQNESQRKTEESVHFTNSMFTVLLCILTVLTTLGVLYSPQLLDLILDANYHQIPGKFELTVRLARIMFGFIFLMSTFGFFMGILNVLGIYGLPAMAPTLFNVAMIASTIVPHHWFPYEGDGLAWGVLLGGLLQTAVLIPALVRHGYFPKIKFGFQSEQVKQDVKKVFQNMLPGLLGMGLLQVTTVVNLKFASELNEGVISYIYWADRLLELPLSLISVSLGTALLPHLSSLWSVGQKQKFSDNVSDYLKLNLYAALPCALGLLILAQPIIELTFMRGKFLAHDAQQTALILKIYSFILITSSSVRVLIPAYYAVKNTWFPAVVSGICLVLHLIFAPILMHRFGLQGLISSTLISGGLNFILLFVFYKKYICDFSYLPWFKSILRFIIPSVGLSIICLAWPYVIDPLRPLGVFLSNFITLAIIIPSAAGVFIFLSSILKIEEYERTFGRIILKLTRRFAKK